VTLWQDLRFAVRLLIEDRWFTAVAAVVLALGIGVNNTVFTLRHEQRRAAVSDDRDGPTNRRQRLTYDVY